MKKYLEIKIMNFNNALDRLKEALVYPSDDDFKLDISIKRFEFTYEICWKAMHSALRDLGVVATSPKQVFDKANKEGILHSTQICLQVKEDRDDTAHEYDINKAKEIYSRIPSYANEFEIILAKLKTDTNN